MKYTIICKRSEYYDPLLGEVIEPKETTFELPYDYNQEVWFVYRYGKKYKVIHDRIASCWCTNGTFGYKLKYSEFCVDNYRFDRLFDSKNDAVDFCLKANERAKVKVKDYE